MAKTRLDHYGISKKDFLQIVKAGRKEAARSGRRYWDEVDGSAMYCDGIIIARWEGVPLRVVAAAYDLTAAEIEDREPVGMASIWASMTAAAYQPATVTPWRMVASDRTLAAVVSSAGASCFNAAYTAPFAALPCALKGTGARAIIRFGGPDCTVTAYAVPVRTADNVAPVLDAIAATYAAEV